MNFINKFFKWAGVFFVVTLIVGAIGTMLEDDNQSTTLQHNQATAKDPKALEVPDDLETYNFKNYIQDVLLDQNEPQQIIEYLVSTSKILTPTDVPAVRAYISQYALTKDQNITLKTAVSWVELAKDNGIDLSKKVSADKLIFNIDPYDHSFRVLEELLELTLNDPDSYEHVQTIYKFRFDDARPHVVVWSKFRANNAYGAKVLQTIDLKFDLSTLRPFE